jgi:multisubunit Na+/H+ antiporter MnhB subunit
MKSTGSSESPKLSAVTSGFVLAAAIAILFNTALAWAKDAYAPLTDFMKALTGHHWTTHGLADLGLFVALGFIFTHSKIAGKTDPNRLIGFLIGAVVIGALGLALWYVFV